MLGPAPRAAVAPTPPTLAGFGLATGPIMGVHVRLSCRVFGTAQICDGTAFLKLIYRACIASCICGAPRARRAAAQHHGQHQGSGPECGRPGVPARGGSRGGAAGLTLCSDAARTTAPIACSSSSSASACGAASHNCKQLLRALGTGGTGSQTAGKTAPRAREHGQQHVRAREADECWGRDQIDAAAGLHPNLL